VEEVVEVSAYVELLEEVMYQQAGEFMGSLPAVLFQVTPHAGNPLLTS
jgi:hypothetical protein